MLKLELYDDFIDEVRRKVNYVSPNEASFGEEAMLKTITMGSCISVQGTFVRALGNGKIAVQVGQRIFEGTPVASNAA